MDHNIYTVLDRPKEYWRGHRIIAKERHAVVVRYSGNRLEIDNVVLWIANRLEIKQSRVILDCLGEPRSRIVFIEDRKGHDRAYVLDTSRIRKLGWKPAHGFKPALEATVRWYRDNRAWWERVKSGAFRDYYERHYRTKLKKGKSYGA